jgi:hypothetical protein
MALKYGSRPAYDLTGTSAEHWSGRFPSNARPMNSAPISASWPIRLFEPSGASRFGVNYLGAWREVTMQRDSNGTNRVRMNGNLIANPVAWSSS